MANFFQQMGPVPARLPVMEPRKQLVRRLSIKDQRLQLDTKDDVKAFLPFHLCTMATSLEISGNSLSPVAVEQVVDDALAYTPSLQELYMDDVFSGRSRNAIHRSLQHIGGFLLERTTVVLDLSNNAIGSIGVASLMSAIGHSTSLRVLRLSNTGLGLSGGDLVAGALIELHSNTTANGKAAMLEELRLDQNRLGDEAVRSLGNCFWNV
jgi:Ran GTPase-activating protein 1